EDGRRAVAMAVDAPRSREPANLVNQGLEREQRRLRSLERFVGLDSDLHSGSEAVSRLRAGLADAAKGLLATLPPASPPTAADTRVPVRNRAVKGPLAPGGDWLKEKTGGASVSLAIAAVANGDDVTYEIVNFVDGVRTIAEIRDAVSAEFE